jgi:hypothetical protein
MVIQLVRRYHDARSGFLDFIALYWREAHEHNVSPP